MRIMEKFNLIKGRLLTEIIPGATRRISLEALRDRLLIPLRDGNTAILRDDMQAVMKGLARIQVRLKNLSGGLTGEIDLTAEGGAFGKTVKGGRRANEDGIDIFGKKNFILADGMGGPAEGEVASNLALLAYRSAIENGADMRAALLAAHNKLVERKAPGHASPLNDAAGTTFAAVQIVGDTARITHVGDSLVLLVKKDGVVQLLTFPHSQVANLFREENNIGPAPYSAETMLEFIKYEENMRGFKHIIKHALGTILPEEKELAPLSVKLEAGDRLLLFSDGLTFFPDGFTDVDGSSPSGMPYSRLKQLITWRGPVQAIVRQLIAETEAAASDNISIIMYEHVPTLKALKEGKLEDLLQARYTMVSSDVFIPAMVKTEVQASIIERVASGKITVEEIEAALAEATSPSVFYGAVKTLKDLGIRRDQNEASVTLRARHSLETDVNLKDLMALVLRDVYGAVLTMRGLPAAPGVPMFSPESLEAKAVSPKEPTPSQVFRRQPAEEELFFGQSIQQIIEGIHVSKISEVPTFGSKSEAMNIAVLRYRDEFEAGKIDPCVELVKRDEVIFKLEDELKETTLKLQTALGERDDIAARIDLIQSDYKALKDQSEAAVAARVEAERSAALLGAEGEIARLTGKVQRWRESMKKLSTDIRTAKERQGIAEAIAAELRSELKDKNLEIEQLKTRNSELAAQIAIDKASRAEVERVMELAAGPKTDPGIQLKRFKDRYGVTSTQELLYEKGKTLGELAAVSKTLNEKEEERHVLQKYIDAGKRVEDTHQFNISAQQANYQKRKAELEEAVAGKIGALRKQLKELHRGALTDIRKHKEDYPKHMDEMVKDQAVFRRSLINETVQRLMADSTEVRGRIRNIRINEVENDIELNRSKANLARYENDLAQKQSGRAAMQDIMSNIVTALESFKEKRSALLKQLTEIKDRMGTTGIEAIEALQKDIVGNLETAIREIDEALK